MSVKQREKKPSIALVSIMLKYRFHFYMVAFILVVRLLIQLKCVYKIFK